MVVPSRKEKDFLASYYKPGSIIRPGQKRKEDEKEEQPEEEEEELLKDIMIVPGSALDLGLEDKEKNKVFRVLLFHKFEDAQMPR